MQVITSNQVSAEGLMPFFLAVMKLKNELGDKMLAVAENDLDVLPTGHAIMDNSKPLEWKQVATANLFLSHVLGKSLLMMSVCEHNPNGELAQLAAERSAELALMLKGQANIDIADHIATELKRASEPTHEEKTVRRSPSWATSLGVPEPIRSVLIHAATLAAGVAIGGVFNGNLSRRDALSPMPEAVKAEVVPSTIVKMDSDLRLAYTGVPRTAKFTPFRFMKDWMEPSALKEEISRWTSHQAKFPHDYNNNGYHLDCVVSYCFALSLVGKEGLARSTLNDVLTPGQMSDFERRYNEQSLDLLSEQNIILRFLKIHGMYGHKVWFKA